MSLVWLRFTLTEPLKRSKAVGLITRTRRIISCPDRQEIRDAGDFNERYLYPGLQELVFP